MHSRHVKTAVFPVAGLGKRFLPAMKATPKESPAVIDVSLIQFAIDEARDVGIARMVFVDHPAKTAIEADDREDAERADKLRSRGIDDLAHTLDPLALGDDGAIEVVFANQPEPLGLGHAMLCACQHVGEGAFAVIFPDDPILGAPGCLPELIEAHRYTGGHLVAAMKVARDETSNYGFLAPQAVEGRIVRASGLVGKPLPEDAPSRLAASADTSSTPPFSMTSRDRSRVQAVRSSSLTRSLPGSIASGSLASASRAHGMIAGPRPACSPRPWRAPRPIPPTARFSRRSAERRRRAWRRNELDHDHRRGRDRHAVACR